MSYFSNGTEGSAWMHDWCDRCVGDHDEMHVAETGPGCPIMGLHMCEPNDLVPQWIDNTETEGFTFPPAVTCIEFRRCSCDRGPDDPGVETPPPVDPDQTVMFDADVLAPGVPRAVFLDELVSQ